MRARWLVAVPLVLAACGGAGRSGKLTPKNPFPTRDALEKLASAPPKPVKTEKVASVDQWSIEAASLDGTASGAETTLSMAAAKKGQLTLAKELRCVAREIARFWIEQKAEPTARLKRFVDAACGATSAVDIWRTTVQVPAKVPDADLAKELADRLDVPASMRSRAGGVALARKGDDVVMMIATGRADAAMAIELPDATGRARVTGTIAPHVNADLVVAMMNYGPGSVRCDTNFSVPLPRFDFSCPMAPDDQLAPLEIIVHEPGRLVTRAVASALVKRAADTPLTLAPSQRPKRPVTTPQELARATIEGVNEARAAAKLGPLVAAPRQAALNERLAEHFFAADRSGDGATEDTIVLGLIAGWDVEGLIRHGDFYATLTGGTNDASALLDYTLDAPSARTTLLSPEASQIAVGAPPFDRVGGLGMVATTYSFFGSYDHRADAQRIFDRLTGARLSQNLPKPQRIPQTPELASQAKLAATGRRDPMDALAQGAMLEGQRLGRWLQGWAFVGYDLDAIVFPRELFAPSAIAVGIEVTHFRPEGAAWGAYLVYVVAPGGANIQSAQWIPGDPEPPWTRTKTASGTPQFSAFVAPRTM